MTLTIKEHQTEITKGLRKALTIELLSESNQNKIELWLKGDQKKELKLNFPTITIKKREVTTNETNQ